MCESRELRTALPLAGSRARFNDEHPAVTHAARLLGLLGAAVEPDAAIDGLLWEGGPEVIGDAARDEVADWAASGAMALTGPVGGAPLVAPGAPATVARGAALAVEALTASMPGTRTIALDGAKLLGERAALAGLARAGPVSPGGSCRLITTGDGLLAVNLSRPDDFELLPAWLETGTGADPWDTVTAECARRSATELADRGQHLGIPVARVPQPREVKDDDQGQHRSRCFPPDPWRMTIDHASRHDHEGTSHVGLVVDLSSMWAGPLCANLLGLAGFRVVKVESVSRPDGARSGPAAFFDLLHGGHESVVVDFGDSSDLARLGSLLASADIVIESSRPRALDQLGVGPAVILARSRSTVWVSITGYGRSGPWQNRVAFGDDAAAAAGMVVSGPDGSPMFCGDAIADPLAGLHAALGAFAMRRGGCGGLVDVALREVVASTLAGVPTRPDRSSAARSASSGWVLDTPTSTVAVSGPRARRAPLRAPEAGADTERVLGALLAG